MKILPVYLVFALFLVHCQSTSKPSSSTAEKIQNPIDHPNQLAKDGLLREAIEGYQSILKKEPNNLAARRNMGMVYVKLKDYKHAIRHLQPSVGKKDEDGLFALGEAHRAEEQYNEAVYYLKAAFDLNTENLKTMKSLTWAYFRNKNYAQANSLAKRMHKMAADDGQVAIIYARILLKLKQNNLALQVITRAKNKSTDPLSKPFFLSVEGDVYLALNRCSKAIPIYLEALKDQPLLAGSLLGLGRCQLEVGQAEKAIDYMERATRIQPKIAEGYLYLAKAYENKSKAKALHNYRIFQKLAGDDPEYLSMIQEIRLRISSLSPNETPKAQ
jgi:tetratricopeptide (TPR) repeat protein